MKHEQKNQTDYPSKSASELSTKPFQPSHPTGGDPDEYNRSVNAQHLTDDSSDPQLRDLRSLLENSH